MIAFLNGKFLNISECFINPLDRGFMFGDGVYEVMPVYNKEVFLYADHMKRLSYSLVQTEIENPYNEKHWKDIITELIDKSNLNDLSIYLQITRGIADRDHTAVVETQPTVFIMPIEIHHNDELKKGVSTVTTEDIRWQRCDIKSISLLANVMLRRQARTHNAYEAILFDKDILLEGAASNVFTVKDEVIRTPRLNRKILAGVTRAIVIEIAKKSGFSCLEEDITKKELLESNEVWLSSSTKEILPVTQIDGKKVADGKPGEIWNTISNGLREWKEIT